MAAMFRKEEGGREFTPNTKPETVIGPTVKVEGTFESQDNVLVDGIVMGSLKTTKDLTVGQGARIEADVTAANMHIAGEVHGNLKASGAMTLTSSARVFGDVETGIISVETGAVLQGRCVANGGKNADVTAKVVPGATTKGVGHTATATVNTKGAVFDRKK